MGCVGLYLLYMQLYYCLELVLAWFCMFWVSTRHPMIALNLFRSFKKCRY